MAYWMLLVSPHAACPTRHAFEVPLFSDYEADYDVRLGTEDDWREVKLVFTGEHDDDDDEDDVTRETLIEEFATVYRESNEAAVSTEVRELIADLVDVEPQSGAQWVIERLRQAKAIYKFTPHHRDRDRALDALRAVMRCIQRETHGIVYVEGEGWSNEDGTLREGGTPAGGSREAEK